MRMSKWLVALAVVMLAPCAPALAQNTDETTPWEGGGGGRVEVQTQQMPTHAHPRSIGRFKQMMLLLQKPEGSMSNLVHWTQHHTGGGGGGFGMAPRIAVTYIGTITGTDPASMTAANTAISRIPLQLDDLHTAIANNPVVNTVINDRHIDLSRVVAVNLLPNDDLEILVH